MMYIYLVLNNMNIFDTQNVDILQQRYNFFIFLEKKTPAISKML